MTEVVSFGELLSYPLRSGVTVAAANRGAGIKMLNMGELFAMPRIEEAEMARVNIDWSDEERYLLEEGDLVFARRSLTLEGAGKCSIVKICSEPTTWESSILRARVDRNLADPDFYFYFFQSPQGRRAIEAIVEQVAAAGIRSSELGKLRVPMPPLQEQRAVADFLGALDDKITANTELATAAGDLAALKYRRATTGLGQVPMSSRLTPVLGGTPTRSNEDFWGGEVPWISAKDVTGAGHGVVLDTDEHITPLAATTTKAKPLPVGSVILTARGTVGAVARLSVPSAFNQSCYGFVPDGVPPGVLYFAIASAADEARSLAHGSVFDTITMKTFDHLGFPNLDSESMASLEGEVGPLLDSVAATEHENQRLAATRDVLLPALISGKLRVEDAAEVAGV